MGDSGLALVAGGLVEPAAIPRAYQDYGFWGIVLLAIAIVLFAAVRGGMVTYINEIARGRA